MKTLDDGRVAARDICERQIQATARAMLDNDFEEFAKWFALPWEFETFDASRRIETCEQFRDCFDRVHRHYRRLGATRLERRCIAADFQDHETMHSTHETRVLRGTELLLEPYPTFEVSRRVDGRWQIVKSSYAVVDQPAFVEALMGTR